MKIAVLIPPFTTLPAKGQGGTERVAEGMINELVKRGHDVTLFGAGDCQPRCKFHQVFKKTITDEKFDSAEIESSRPLRIETAYITKVMKYLSDHDGEFDVVFNHLRGGYLLLPLFEKLRTPVISVFHLPLFEEIILALEDFENPLVTSISNSQRKPAGDRINFLATVYNGLELSEFEFNSNPDDYFVFIGAMGEHKAPHLAIEAAKKAGTNLKLIGGKTREPYFSEIVKPQLDGTQIQYLGEIDSPTRNELLKNAKGFLFPINWEEPFGLVVIEAMACGAVPIVFDHGAMREIIDDGIDGFIVSDVDQMSQRIREIRSIDRKKCREKVEQKFTYEKMVDGYMQAYGKIKK